MRVWVVSDDRVRYVKKKRQESGRVREYESEGEAQDPTCKTGRWGTQEREEGG